MVSGADSTDMLSILLVLENPYSPGAIDGDVDAKYN
jgi:hypothetical protein